MVVARTPAIPRRSITPLPEDENKAKVTEVTTKTSEYVADKPKDETENKGTSGTGESPNVLPNSQTRSANRFSGFANQNETIAPDRLSAMFEELRETQDYDGEQFLACITRLPDHMNDRFNMTCNSIMNFAVLAFTTTDIHNFIPQIQRYNSNSGGRFQIRITDQSGEDLEIGLSNYVIANPPIAETSLNATNVGSPSGDITALLSMMQKQSDQQNQNMLTLIQALNQPKPDDEFTQMVKEKMRNDFLNPPEKKSSFDPQEFAGKILESQVMMQTVTTMLTNTIQNAGGGSGSNQDKGIILSLLENEKVMDIVGNTVDNVTTVLGDLALAKAGADNLQQQSNPQQQQPMPQQDYVEQAPEQLTPEQEAANAKGVEDMKVITDRIITELLSENVIDNDNVMLNSLTTEYPQYMPLIKVACKGQSFEQVLKTLIDLAPDQFASVDDNDRPRLEERLKEFYDYLKTS